MIAFFRKIRQRLLTENKVSRYILYAIGEIVLVVIGILIALQINTWNEDRKADNFELQLLNAFEDGLNDDLADLDFNVAWHQRGMAAIDTILYYLQTGKAHNNDTIARLFSDAMTPTRFTYSTSAFETLKSQGITTIRNIPLRNNIIGVYDTQYTFFLSYQFAHIDEIERGFKEVFNTRFEDSYYYDLQSSDFAGAIKPLDFESLKNDQEFLYYIKSLRNRTMILVDYQYATLRNRIVDVMSQIQAEIKS